MKKVIIRLRSLVHQHRRVSIVASHVVMIVLAYYLAFWLRFDGHIPAQHMDLFLTTLPWLVGIRAITFFPFRLYTGMWRYAGLWDVRNIVLAVLCSSALFHVLVHGAFSLDRYPRSIFIIDALLLIVLLSGLRMAWRLYHTLPKLRQGKRVLIYGAGDAGEMILRDMKNHRGLYKYNPIGFIDDDPNKLGACIHGIPVLGDRRLLSEIIGQKNPQELLIAIPSANREVIQNIVKAVESLNIAIKTLPNLREIKDGRANLSQIRKLSAEDFLNRAPVGLDLEPVRRLIRGKRILVTGAGGSIGSELSRQIAECDPATLVLLDKSESALFAIDTELGRKYPALNKSAALIDIKHTMLVKELFRKHSPQFVFHAAAYKHVPMMEFHPEEAVLNNVIGTCRLSHIAIEHNVESFILISTDKAVNPTSIMGTTKRVAEMYVSALESDVPNARRIFSIVRFGNVLGSSGSVVPLFCQQIENGGPVTVTHPAITRYFMTIPEAVSLVLRASTMAQGGEIFVLDMGSPINLADLARHLIRSSGLIPDKDIEIRFVGLRPGEKLYEELFGSDEQIEATEVNEIVRIRPSARFDQALLLERISEMERLAIGGKTEALIGVLREVVPNFTPTGSNGNGGYEPLASKTAPHAATVNLENVAPVVPASH